MVHHPNACCDCSSPGYHLQQLGQIQYPGKQSAQLPAPAFSKPGAPSMDKLLAGHSRDMVLCVIRAGTLSAS